MKNFLKTSYYNQVNPHKQQKLDKLVNVERESTVEASNTETVRVTTQYGQTSTSVKSSINNKGKVKMTGTITQGVKDNGLYMSADSDGNKEGGVKAKVEGGERSFELKVGVKSKR